MVLYKNCCLVLVYVVICFVTCLQAAVDDVAVAVQQPESSSVGNLSPDPTGTPAVRMQASHLQDALFLGVAGFDAVARKDASILDRVAAMHGKTLVELKREMRHDADLGIDPDSEALFYRCAGLEVVGSGDQHSEEEHSHRHSHEVTTPGFLSAASDLVAQQALSPDSVDPSYQDAFKLHSRPGASKLIFLDFDGKLFKNHFPVVCSIVK